MVTLSTFPALPKLKLILEAVFIPSSEVYRLARGPIHVLGLVKYGMQVKTPEPGLKAHKHLTLTALYPNQTINELESDLINRCFASGISEQSRNDN